MTDYYAQLLSAIERSGKQFNLPLIEKAYRLAEEKHRGQMRQSGEPYISHPVAAAVILIELGMDAESIVAAILHDVVEDTEVTDEQVGELFGKEIASLVDGVTKLGKIPFHSREEQQAENIRKMLLAMSQDIRVIIIKLADRLHNMRTLSAKPPQKQRETALETMEVYAPIAHRLGISAVKEELEDLSIRYLDPMGTKEIEESLNVKREERTQLLNTIIEHINRRLDDHEMKYHIEGRVKSIYGIYRKLYFQNRSFDEIYDVYAVRIIVNTVIECYNVLGVIHDLFKPIPGRFKDYISTPKDNLYQSLHTTVLGKEGVPFEVQIRTWDMHYTAEYGIAAHWKYKLGLKGKDGLEDRLAWIRQLLEAQKESDDASDILQSIKSDLLPEQVFVFTPKGDVINLPSGSTVVDFAYAIHTAVGNRMVGAKVDGRIVSIDYKLKTGEIAEVLVSNSKNTGPNRDWLKIVKTSEAKTKIRQWFKKERREENIIEGRIEVEREFRRNSIKLPGEQMDNFIENIAKKQTCETADDFYAAIGYGGIVLSKIMPRIKEEYLKTVRAEDLAEDIADSIVKDVPSRNVSGAVIVEGLSNCLIRFAKCCNPLPGDEIVGFITRGYGVSIHKKDCVNSLSSMQSEPDRWVRARWDVGVRETFKATLNIYAVDRPMLMADIAAQLGAMHLSISSINGRALRDGHAVMTVTIEINSVEHLKSIITRLLKVRDVVEIERANN